MNKAIAILACCLCANIALGGIIVSTPEPGWAGLAWIEGGDFGRGAMSRNTDPTTGDWEPGIGNDHALGEDALNLNWGGAGASNPFALDYDPLRLKIEKRIVEERDTALLDPAAPFEEMYMDWSGGMFGVSGVATGINVFAASLRENPEGRYIHTRNSDVPLSDLDFILSGPLHIDWTAAASPSKEEIGMSAELMSQIPEPASIIMITLVSGLGLFIRRKFRS